MLHLTTGLEQDLVHIQSDKPQCTCNERNSISLYYISKVPYVLDMVFKVPFWMRKKLKLAL